MMITQVALLEAAADLASGCCRAARSKMNKTQVDYGYGYGWTGYSINDDPEHDPSTPADFVILYGMIIR
jgi:hypothetical protein